jgi:hypothetical protein
MIVSITGGLPGLTELCCVFNDIADIDGNALRVHHAASAFRAARRRAVWMSWFRRMQIAQVRHHTPAGLVYSPS